MKRLVPSVLLAQTSAAVLSRSFYLGGSGARILEFWRGLSLYSSSPGGAASGPDQGRPVQPAKPCGDQVVYYRGPRIIITSCYIENANGRYKIRELDLVERVHVDSHATLLTALVCGLVELGLGSVLALAHGGAILVGVGVVAGAGMAAALVVDDRRNPRWMALQAAHHGRVVTLFSSRSQLEFEQVRRATIRAVEASERPRL